MNLNQTLDKLKTLFTIDAGSPGERMNQVALDMSIQFIGKLVDIVKEVPYKIRDSSLLIVIDNNKPNNSAIKLIDLDGVTEMKEDYRDKGFIFGLQNLRKKLI